GLPPLFQSWTDIDDLAAVGAQVVNMSFGLQKPSFFDPSIVPSGVVSLPLFARVKAVYEHVMAAYPNIIFVAGAGNSGADVADFIPAGINLPNVIAVAATDLNDQRATFGTNASSNFGNLVAIAAPGKEVYAPKFFTSPLDADDYLFFSGTSAAAPMVTGVIGILKAIEGNLGLTPDQIKEILQQTGDPTDQTISGKRLNACKAVQRVLEMKNGLPPSFACPNSPPTITSITANPTAVHVGGQSTISIQASDPDGDPLVYLWVASCGTLSAQTGKEDKIWTAPAAVPSLGTCTVSVFVDDPAGSSGTTHENVFIDVTESPQVFYVTLLEGNPGIPGDGVIVSKIGGFIENFFELQPPFPLAGITNGITISAFPPSGVSLADSRLLSVMGRLLGQLDPCFFVVGGLDPKIITVNGVQGIAESISQELLNL
ncbi:MAG: S8 family serine peptidase, partial [Pseudomonadota bacterium]|nr:S8 family serine peptidase [Pseudomonadota bacterium]